MKQISAFILTLALFLSSVCVVKAQGAENIWLEAPAAAYKTGDIVLVTIHAKSVTPIQGFTFQIRYDPACLQPVNASSPIPGMNGLSLPQTSGLVDASFASTVPQAANGLIAEVQFRALAGCQTRLVLESAGLAIRNAEGYAAQLPGVTIGAREIPVSVDVAAGEAQALDVLGTPLVLGPEAETGAGGLSSIVVGALIFLGILVVGGVIFLIIKML